MRAWTRQNISLQAIRGCAYCRPTDQAVDQSLFTETNKRSGGMLFEIMRYGCNAGAATGASTTASSSRWRGPCPKCPMGAGLCKPFSWALASQAAVNNVLWILVLVFFCGTREGGKNSEELKWKPVKNGRAQFGTNHERGGDMGTKPKVKGPLFDTKKLYIQKSKPFWSGG